MASGVGDFVDGRGRQWLVEAINDAHQDDAGLGELRDPGKSHPTATRECLKRTGRWSLSELSSLWNEEALTAAVLPRWHIDQSIKRQLGHRLGSLKAA